MFVFAFYFCLVCHRLVQKLEHCFLVRIALFLEFEFGHFLDGRQTEHFGIMFTGSVDYLVCVSEVLFTEDFL